MPRRSGDVRTRLSFWQKIFYAVVRFLVGALCRFLWRVQIRGTEHIPLTGPFILSPVHRSYIDAALLALMGNRPVRFMGKDSLWRHPVTDWFFTSMGGLPVRRGVPDREAVRACERLLAHGQGVVIFPEGTRRSGSMVQSISEGAAYLATKMQAPIVPVGIGGSERATPRGTRRLRRVKISIVIGEPIPPPSPNPSGRVPRRAVRALTEQLAVRLQAAFDDAQEEVIRRG